MKKIMMNLCVVEEIIREISFVACSTKDCCHCKKEIIKYSDGMMLQAMTRLCEQLQMWTCDHHLTTIYAYITSDQVIY